MTDENKELESEQKERRFAKRFEIRETYISLRFFKKINWFSEFIGPFQVNNISISSACFECMEDFPARKEVEIKILSSNLQSDLKLKGKIIEKSTIQGNENFIYIILFSPFGSGYKYNSMHSKRKLTKFFDSLSSS